MRISIKLLTRSLQGLPLPRGEGGSGSSNAPSGGRPRGACRGPALLWALTLLGCGGSVSSSLDEGALTVEGISVFDGMQWKLNRPIDITFNLDIDFSTVNMNTINIVDPLGRAATGVFTFPTNPDGTANTKVVRFRPNCPRLQDFSDAGLTPSTSYRLTVLGSDLGGVTVRSVDGDVLKKGSLVKFQTPNSTSPLDLFLDTVPGPPAVRLRGASGVAADDMDACYAEIGGQRVYFQLDLSNQTGRIPFELPLNHYSIAENQVAVVVHFNQPVDATPANIAPAFVSIQYNSGVQWLDIQSDMDLFENCTATGAGLRMIPRGILPQDRQLRVVVRQGFADLTGDAISADLTRFALADTVAVGDPNPLFPGVDNPEVDEVYETFALSGNALGSLEDTAVAYEVPRADWGSGELRASFAFGGTGGPGGDFDWYLKPGVDFILNTVSDTIVGGPGGAPTGSQAVINGVVDIRDLFVPASSRLIIQGPNTCTILATGTVTVLGEISVRGSDSTGVQTLNTANQPEPGAKGNAGGGDGGTGSYLTFQSTPRGGVGEGALGIAYAGGEGGETCYAWPIKDDRRGSGGGGGVFGPDILYDYKGSNGGTLVSVQALIGLDVERGAGGGPGGLGAVSQSVRAKGGLPGPSPFFDGTSANDFYGTMLLSTGALVTGELIRTHAGAGGGAGGDAVSSNSFPLDPWNPTGDEKGCGGGGGGGGLKILSIGEVIVGSATVNGILAAEGGTGGGGENAASFDRLGGGSGGGSGGHIVVSSADKVTIYGIAEDALDWYSDDITDLYHTARPISAVGGHGGAGHNGWGGSNGKGIVSWRCDRIPWELFQFLDEPPQGLPCFVNLPDKDDPVEGPVIGAGGDGGPGLIQFHVPDPDINLIFPTLEALVAGQGWGETYDDGLDVTKVCAPPPVGFHRPKESLGDANWIPPDYMVPFFGDLSRAQTKWIPLGLARIAPAGLEQVKLRFEGTDVLDGKVDHDGSVVKQLPPLVGPDPLGGAGSPPYVGAGGFTVVLDVSALAASDDLYKQNTQLLRGFSIKLEDAGNASTFQFYTITDASYDASKDEMICSVDPTGPSPANFISSTSILVSLVPHFLRLITSGIHDSYPPLSDIQVRFDATKIDPGTGLPSAASAGWTFDINDLNGDHWDFFRFEVEFEIELDVTSPRPGLDHLRVSYEF